MLLDRFSSEQVFPDEAMGDGVSRKRMDTRRHHMHPFSRESQRGTASFDVPVAEHSVRSRA